MKRSRFRLKQSAIIAASIHLVFSETAAWANPTGPQVVNGIVSMQRPNANTLNITNSPGAIVNWQGFSIGANELTRFIQQSSSSAVLNRVVGADISQIQGQLLSNGRVFLINPAGIVIGPGAVVDTAGFVASTLNMLDGDFLAGKLKFQGDANSGAIINQGWIRTGYGGQVILVAPTIENSGLIHTPGGELILAAGKSLTITSLDLEGVHFEVQAPTDSVLNVGKLLADGGAVGVFAGTLRHSGDIRANALVYDEAGRVVLKAQNEIQLAAGSTTSADGKIGGDITLQAAGGLTRVAGTVSAQGSAGQGGDIKVLGDSVAVVESAVLNASGSAGGGQILVGGDFQGSNASIQNSTNTFVSSSANLRADATQSGDGGRIVVWSDDKTQFYGNLSAQGGPDGGNGGFAEVSGKQNLIFAGGANLGAPKGSLGNLLLDPLDLYVFSGGGILYDTVNDLSEFPSNAATVSPATLAAVTGNVSLNASRYMRISDPITLTTPGQSLTATVGTYTAPALPDPLALSTSTIFNELEIGANITTAGGAVSLSAPTIQSVAASTIATAGGAISLSATGPIQASSLSLDAGSAAVNATAGSFLQLNAVTGGSFTATAPSSISTSGLITTGGGPVTLTSSGSSVTTSSGITSGGGNVNLTGAFSVSNFGTISAGGGSVSLSGTSVSGGTIDTTGSVVLTASSGSIFGTVNNASSLNATATSSSGSAFVSIGSTTDLNANSVSATTTACFSFFGCQSGSVSLSATGNINVGTVTASAPVSGNNSISESISISSSTGSIRAMSASSQLTAADVTLTTGQGTGGGIGTAATALNVDVERNFTFRPNGEFNVLLNGTGPSGLNVQLGVAPTGQNYSGTLTKSAGGLTFTASATDTTVTISNLNIPTGFNQRVFNSTPFISVDVPNGALVATSVTVPEGDTIPTTVSPPYTTAPLPVTLSADGNLTLNSYTRVSTAASLAKSTTISSDTGTITLGTINASKDTVSVIGFGGGVSPADISVSNLSTSGSVSVTTFFGDITAGLIDTTSGTGSVSLSAQFGAVKAQTDSVATEITSGSTISITGQTIGASTFTNPLDMAGSSVTLTSQASGGQIGFAGSPVVANTQNLTINAASTTAFNTTPGAKFNVSTGATALKNLTVTANAPAVGLGPSQVRTEAGTANDKTYSFVGDGSNFTFNPGNIPATQFAGGTLNFTSVNGNVTLGNINMGTGSLVVAAPNGSILGGADLDGASFTLSAATSASGAAASVTLGDIGNSIRPNSVTITSGFASTFSSRVGSVDTGTVNAGNVTINSFNGNIKIGPTGTDNIGSIGTPAGAVSLTANSIGSSSGTVLVGDIFADSITLRSPNNSITSDALNAATSISAISDVSVTTGALDSPSVTIFRNSSCCVNPEISTGAIGTGASGSARPAVNILIAGSTTTINGAVTGASSVDNFSISANGGGSNAGLLTINGAITAGNGSTIGLGSANTTTPFQFSTISAGTTGTVSIGSNNDIRQQYLGGGITAQTVTLSAPSNDIHGLDSMGGAVNLDLIGVKNLTVNTGGFVKLNANGSQLDSINITTNSGGPDTGGITLANMGGGQSFTVSDLGNGDFNLALNSPSSALNFTFDTNSTGIRTTGSGIVTGGGNVTLNAAGLFDGTTGGITTGGATGGGTVNITASGGSLTTGQISTIPTGTGTGGSISASAFCGTCNVVVNGDLKTGTGGGAIFLFGRNVIRSGASQVISDASVTATAFDGDIGASGTPLLITTPTATLSATSGTAGVGSVFATLTNTASLNLTADNDFSVASNTALSTLTLNTEGSGTGTTLTLSAPGQSYSFARPSTDLFGNSITNTFQVVSAGGTPVTNATFRALDGDLLIAGPGTINATNLTLQASSFGDIKLQGNAANPLTLSNTTQNFNTARDLLITGNATLNGGTSQTMSLNRDIIAQAQGGSITISGAAQSIFSSTGKIAFRGGTGADEKVTVSATGSQDIFTSQFGGGNVELTAGSGDRTSVTVSYSGTGTQNVSAGGNVQIDGGTGTSVDSVAAITTATGAQLIRAEGDINLNTIGGSGTNATARIVNSGTGNQQVGESQFFFSSFPYQTNNITVQGGSGSASFAEITAAGPQQIYVNGGTLTVKGGGTNSFARIESTGTSEQRIGFPTYFCCGFSMGSLVLQGGTGSGSYARINAAGFQRVTASSSIGLTGTVADASASLLGAGQDIRFGNMTLTAGSGNNANALVQSTSTQNIDPGNLTLLGGGGAGATATAQILAAGTQTIGFANTVTLTGGAGADSVARIATTGSQTLSFSSMTMTAGAGDRSFVEIEAGGTQNFSGGNMTLIAKGTESAPIPGASAIIEGNFQNISVGAVTLTGGAGTDAANTSDAVIRNLSTTSGNQSVFASSITMNGGHQFSTTGILNPVTGGFQTVSGSSGITLNSDPNAHVDASVLIQNLAATAQTVTASSGGIRLNSGGAGTVGITSAASQEILSRYLEVLTTSGTTMNGGTAQISAATNQRIHTTADSPANTLLGNTINSLAVAALGTGTAKIEAGGAQLLEIGYPEMMQTTGLTGVLRIGDADALGTSRISATNQSVFAGSLVIQGGLATDSIAKLGATTTQTVTTLLGGITLTGGSGSNADALIDPSTQTILANGPIDLTAGSGSGADAAILNTGSPPGPQTIVSTNGNITLTGGTAPGASAVINTLGPASAQTVAASGSIILTQGSGSNALAAISNAGAGPATNNTSSAAGSGSDQVTTLNDYQSQVIEELPPEEDELRTRVPICR